jgi:hypothetical protein
MNYQVERVGRSQVTAPGECHPLDDENDINRNGSRADLGSFCATYRFVPYRPPNQLSSRPAAIDVAYALRRQSPYLSSASGQPVTVLRNDCINQRQGLDDIPDLAVIRHRDEVTRLDCGGARGAQNAVS